MLSLRMETPVINLQFLFGTPGSLIDQGLQLQLEGTLLVSGFGTLLTLALGYMTAIYLVEYAPKERPLRASC